MLKDSKSVSFAEQRQPLPFLQRKKLGADSYVSERVSRIRKQRAKIIKEKQKTSNDEQPISKWKQVSQIRELKKNFIVSSNKIMSNDRILSNIEPYRKQLELMRKKPSATINYQQLFSNLNPFSNAIKELNNRKLENKRELTKSIEESPASLKLYRSIPKKRTNFKTVDKPVSQSRMKYEEVYFLNVGKMSLLDSDEKRLKKGNENYHSSFVERVSSYSVEQKSDTTKTIQDIKTENSHFRQNFSKVKSLKRQEENEQKNSKMLPRIIVNQEIIEQPEEMDKKQQSLVINKQEYAKKQNPFKVIKKKKKITNIPFQTYFYRSLIWKVNYTNFLSVETPQEYQHRLKVYIGKGNNSGLVRGLVKRRIWFAVTEKIEQANFVWTQLKSLPYFRLQQSNKSEATMKNDEGQQYVNSFVSKNDQKEMIKYIENNYQAEERADQRLLNRSKYFSSKMNKIVKMGEIKSTKMQNHLINNYVIGNKKALFNTMNTYYTERGQDVFQYLPLTFHIKNGLEDPIYFKFLKYYYNRAKQIKAVNQKGKNIWIVKPGENSNRGNGINVCLTIDEIKAILKKKQMYPDGTYRTYIVQSYIEKPLLYNKRKFDLRHYMMITCVNGIIKGYWYKEGYVRTTSTQYSLGSNSSNIHLTNDAVQKNLPEYGKYEKGNKLSYDDLQNYIAKVTAKKKQSISFRQHILPKMKKVATDAIRACSGGIDPQRKENNFEIFGLDFMIDSDLKLYLIQINTNPCLELSCPLLGSLIPKMVENTLQMTLDTQFPPPVRYTPKGVHYFKNLEQQNRYQLVYDSRFEKLYECSMTVLDQKLLEEEDDTFEDDGQEFDPED